MQPAAAGAKQILPPSIGLSSNCCHLPQKYIVVSFPAAMKRGLNLRARKSSEDLAKNRDNDAAQCHLLHVQSNIFLLFHDFGITGYLTTQFTSHCAAAPHRTDPADSRAWHHPDFHLNWLKSLNPKEHLAFVPHRSLLFAAQLLLSTRKPRKLPLNQETLGSFIPRQDFANCTWAGPFRTSAARHAISFPCALESNGGVAIPAQMQHVWRLYRGALRRSSDRCF